MVSSSAQGIGLLLIFLFLVGAGLWVLTWGPWRGPVVDPVDLARARVLVRELLTPAELQQLEQTGYLELASPHRSGTRYRIPAGPGPVEAVQPDGVRHLLCLVPLSPLPAPDLVLLHKLWIEADEPEYLRRANKLPVLPGRDTALQQNTWRWWWGE